MDEPPIGSLMRRYFTFKSEDEFGLKKFTLNILAKVKDDVRVITVGEATGRPTKCLLLLGETGAGKTTYVNSLFNYLFSVKFEDNFRLCVKEQQVQDGRDITDSQTDFITVYRIHQMEGMRGASDYLIIDTPGLADTRGEKEQEKIMNNLESFICSDQGITELHCLGIVAKAVENRTSVAHKVHSQKIMILLGKYIPEITNIIATHAVDKTVVDNVLRGAGLKFKTTFPFDNGVLYSPHKLNSGVRERDHRKIKLRWEDWEEQNTEFFSALNEMPAISLSVLRTKKHYEKSVDNLSTTVEELAMHLKTQKNNDNDVNGWSVKKENSRMYEQKKSEEYKVRDKVEEGHHTHNCLKCDVTCETCEDKTFAKFVDKGLEAGYKLGKKVVPIPILGDAVGAAVAGTSGLGAGIIVGVVSEIIGTCSFVKATSCKCEHDISDHEHGQVKISTRTREVLYTDENMKRDYDDAQIKINHFQNELEACKNNIQVGKENVVRDTMKIVAYLKKFREESVEPPETASLLKEKMRNVSRTYYEDAMNIQDIIVDVVQQLESCQLETTANTNKHILGLLDNV